MIHCGVWITGRRWRSGSRGREGRCRSGLGTCCILSRKSYEDFAGPLLRLTAIWLPCFSCC